MDAGSRVGKYEVLRELGHGGFGILYVARDHGLGRDIALKVLRPEHLAREQLVDRFLQEARAAARIDHPGIVTVFECGHDPAGVYIAMELLKGENLAARLKRGRLPAAMGLRIVRQAASALAAAHRAGIIHRDLKPDNLFLVPDAAVVGGERVKLLDFGIAKLVETGWQRAVKTHSMTLLGTPMYMSPEQCKSSAKVDLRTDVYALGCILFELLSGRPPYDGDSGELIAKHQLAPVPMLRERVPEVSPVLDALLTAMLAKDPDDRPANMEQVEARLEACASAEEDAPTSLHIQAAPESPHAEHTTTLSTSTGSRTIDRTRRRMLAGGGAGALGLVVAIVAITRCHGGSTPEPAKPPMPIDAAVVLVPVDAPVVVQAPPPDAAVVVDIDLGNDFSEIEARCNQFKAKEQWQELDVCAKELRAYSPEKSGAFAALAKSENQASILLAKLKSEATRGDLDGAHATLSQIETSSIYRAEAETIFQNAKDRAIRESRATAQALAKKGDCDGLAAFIHDQASDIQAPLKGIACKKEQEGCTDADIARHIDAGQREFASGNNAQAQAEWEAALKCRFNYDVLRHAYVAACKSGAYGKARAYYKQLNATDQNYMLEACPDFDPRK